MTVKNIKCVFCGERIRVEGETLPVHETQPGTRERCDGSGLPVENMHAQATPNSDVVTDGGTTGKAS